jgi:transcriptional regulator of NAD metabolism
LQQFSRSVFFKIYRFIETSAIFGLILTIVIFWYQSIEAKKESEKSAKESRELVANLKSIEQSLSTRYLGIFPNYLPQINDLLKKADPEKPIIIFEDVLYYGIFSAPQDFKEMINHLLHLSKTSQITIAHYDINGNIFRRMIQEGRISPEYLVALRKERNELRRKLRRTGKENIYQKVDSIVSEKYFALSRNDDKATFEKKVKGHLKPLYDSEKDSDSLYFRIDAVKRISLNKSIEHITFQDYLKMYQGISQELITVFKQHNIELVELNEYLVMSCWLNDNKAILAFPSKYNTDEIGFFTQDPVFSEYINTMLDGVKNLSEAKTTDK